MTPPPKTRKSGEDVPVRGWPSVAVDVDGDGLSGTEDPVEEIPLTSGELDWRTGKVVVTGSVVYETKKPRETRGPPVGQGMLAPGLAMETKAVTKEVVLHDRKKGGAGRVGGEWGVFGVAAVAFGAAVMGGQV
ncbi:hypothetical protein FPQ18DRAFT_300128 [Pyronema domesticum]|nr:hypothetical protein FPQ18DRAFT_300128 [Pyronema domesticum]